MWFIKVQTGGEKYKQYVSLEKNPFDAFSKYSKKKYDCNWNRRWKNKIDSF